jgi:hypothetical protein
MSIIKEKMRKAMWYISNGKIPPFWNILPSKIHPDEIEPSYLRTVDSSVKLPSYISSNQNISYKKSTYEGKSQKKYFSVLEGKGNEVHVDLKPKCEIKGCYFHIINANNYEKVSVSITGTVSNKKISKETKFTAGEQMRIDPYPVSASFDEPVKELSIDVVGKNHQASRFPEDDTTLFISTPSVRNAQQKGTPIFLISIDTFRYDHLDIFDDLEDILGESVIPEEPRTQGRYTRPSHASITTGTHPGTHGYCTGFGRQLKKGIPITSISPDLSTLPEVLTENGYTCGACTSWTSLTPQYGFGRGFQEFRVEKRDWDKYRQDRDTVVNRALEWTEQMISSGQQDIFYFMHIFDAHLPYLSFKTLSENQEINVDMTDEFKESYINSQPLNYDELIEYSTNVETPEYIDDLKQYYFKSLENISSSLERFVHTLKYYNILEKSLIISTSQSVRY